jgi:hypothetical protein
LPDRVFRVVRQDGSEVIVHVEIQVRAEAKFEVRLGTYFMLLSERYDTPPYQVVIMPMGGPYEGRFRYGRLALDYDVVDVPRLDPVRLLAGDLAPLALWSAPEPEVLVDQVVDRIAALGDLDQQTVLVELAILRSERVARLIRDALQRRNMSNVLEGTELGQELLARGEARGEAKGEAKGEVRGRAGVLLALLADRFGDVPELAGIAESLAADADVTSSVKRIQEAQTLQELIS